MADRSSQNRFPSSGFLIGFLAISILGVSTAVIVLPHQAATFRTAPQRDDAPLGKLGAASLLLRERDSWVLRGTVKQLRELERAGYVMKEQANREPVPRRIQIVLAQPFDVNNQIGGRVEIVGIQRVRGRRAITVTGEAFDDAIKDLRARGLKVEILPDYPGVVR